MKLKKNYEKPELQFVDIELDSSIAAGSGGVPINVEDSQTISIVPTNPAKIYDYDVQSITDR